MKVYFDAKSKVWICESEFLGRKYIGEGRTEKEAVSLCLEWENALANEVQNELRKCDQQVNDRELDRCSDNSEGSQGRRNGVEEGDLQ